MRWSVQTDEADESPRRPFLDRPETPASFVDQSHDSLDKRIALLPRPYCRIVVHDLGVSTHRGEWFQVGWPPLPECETGSVEFSGMGHDEGYGNKLESLSIRALVRGRGFVK